MLTPDYASPESTSGTLSLADKETYFARWLTLFTETANEVMTTPHAEVAVRKANLIAMNMKRVLAFPKHVAAGLALEIERH